MYSGFPELLAVEEHLPGYNAYIVRRMAQYLAGGKSVLDFGAGIGTLAIAWEKQTGIKPECLEVDTRQRQMIVERGFTCYPSTEAVRKRFAGIYSSNVLEHIEDDLGALKQVRSLLAEGGLLAVFVPAFMSLFSAFDSSLGHYRRYARAELIEKVRSAGFQVVLCEYVDCLGFYAWFLKMKLLRGNAGVKLPNATELRFYDRWIFPASTLLDRLLMRRVVGKNLLLFAKR